MAARRIVVSSQALGRRSEVTVWVYESADALRAASARFHGRKVGPGEDGVLGVTQAMWSRKTNRCHGVIVRLAVGHLGCQVVSHEMHHASTALYGTVAGDRISSLSHLHHHNEPFAHLFSDLYSKLVRRLYDLGYYDE